MAKKITVQHVNMKEDGAEFEIGSKLEKDVTASGRMLVDSDQFAFIYILEAKEDYHYLSIPSSFWKEVKEVLQKNMEVQLVSNGDKLVLEGFHDELSYLISNIEGNTNYGEEMVRKVESIFLNQE